MNNAQTAGAGAVALAVPGSVAMALIVVLQSECRLLRFYLLTRVV